MPNLPEQFILRRFAADDEQAVNRLAIAAFREFATAYDNWEGMVETLSKTADLHGPGDLIVAERNGIVGGAVGYMPPHVGKPDYFDVAWPVIRMLVVDPDVRGAGLGRALTEACIARAKRDGCPVIALHTSPIMVVALAMYRRLGFRHVRDAPAIHGVDYAVYLKTLEGPDVV